MILYEGDIRAFKIQLTGINWPVIWLQSLKGNTTVKSLLNCKGMELFTEMPVRDCSQC